MPCILSNNFSTSSLSSINSSIKELRPPRPDWEPSLKFFNLSPSSFVISPSSTLLSMASILRWTFLTPLASTLANAFLADPTRLTPPLPILSITFAKVLLKGILSLPSIPVFPPLNISVKFKNQSCCLL